MIQETRFAIHPEHSKSLDTTQLRKHFLVDNLFVDNVICLVYSHYDRLIVGGIKPVQGEVALEPFDSLKAKYFLERRELGIINVGGTGTINIDGEMFSLQNKEALYIGQGVD